MKIHIRKRNVEVTKVLRGHVESRLGLALGRFGERIGRVIVRFSDTDGHRSALDKRCQIDVGLRPRSVRVEDMDVDLFVAVDSHAGCAVLAERSKPFGQAAGCLHRPPLSSIGLRQARCASSGRAVPATRPIRGAR